MSEIEKRVRTQASKSFQALNPGFFNPTHKSMLMDVESILPSKRAISQREAIARHSRNDLAGKFLSIWKLLCGPKLEEEFRFHPERRFRCDFCHLSTRTCIEIEGGIFARGGHSSVSGILRDIEKYNELTYLGFRLIRLHSKSIDVPNLTRLIRFLERKKI